MAGTSREDWIDAPNPIPDGWEPDGPAVYFDIDDGLEAIHQKLANWVTVGMMVGGIFTCVAVRKEIAPGMFITDGFGFKWDSYAPAAKLDRDEGQEPRRRRPRHEQPASEQPVEEVAALGEPLDEELATTGEDDPDGIPDDHRVSSAAVLGG